MFEHDPRYFNNAEVEDVSIPITNVGPPLFLVNGCLHWTQPLHQYDCVPSVCYSSFSRYYRSLSCHNAISFALILACH